MKPCTKLGNIGQSLETFTKLGNLGQKSFEALDKALKPWAKLENLGQSYETLDKALKPWTKL